jgi:hypothetical protein
MLNIHPFELPDFNETLNKKSLLELAEIAKAKGVSVEELEPDESEFVEINEINENSGFVNISQVEVDEIRKVEFQTGYEKAQAENQAALDEVNKKFYSIHSLIDLKLNDLVEVEREAISNIKNVFSELLAASIHSIWADNKVSEIKVMNFVEEIFSKINPKSTLIVTLSENILPMLKVNIEQKASRFNIELCFKSRDDLKDDECNIEWESGYAKFSLENIKDQAIDLIKKYFAEVK